MRKPTLKVVGPGTSPRCEQDQNPLLPPFPVLLTLTERDGLTPQEVALGVPGTNGHAVSHQPVSGIAAKVNGASRLGAGLAQKEAMQWSPGQAAVGSWKTRPCSGDLAQVDRQTCSSCTSHPLFSPPFPCLRHSQVHCYLGRPEGWYWKLATQFREAKEKKKATQEALGPLCSLQAALVVAKVSLSNPIRSQINVENRIQWGWFQKGVITVGGLRGQLGLCSSPVFWHF